MSNKFWRFSYDDGQLDTILNSEELHFPNLANWPNAKNDKEEKVIGKLRDGHFILLANFDLNTRIGTVRGVGIIREIKNGSPTILWKPAPGWPLAPDPRGGVTQWRDEAIFCFASNPAERYKLPSLTRNLFKDT
jgi:hypothetical protein